MKLTKPRKRVLVISAVVLSLSVAGAYAWFNLRQIQLPYTCSFVQKTVPAKDLKDEDYFVISNYDNELKFFRLENRVYMMLATAHRDRQNYSACVVDLDNSTNDLGQATIRMMTTPIAPKFEDIDQDGDKDILIPYVLDYDKQNYNYLFINHYGKYEIIEGVEEHADVKYDKSRGMFYAETIKGPYDYSYAEFNSETPQYNPNVSKRIRIYLTITRLMLGDQSYMYTLHLISNEGSLKKISDHITREKWTSQEALTDFIRNGLLYRI